MCQHSDILSDSCFFFLLQCIDGHDGEVCHASVLGELSSLYSAALADGFSRTCAEGMALQGCLQTTSPR